MALPEPVPPAADLPPRGPGWRFWARMLVSAALLGVLIWNVPDLDGVLPAGHHRRTIALLAAAAITTLLGVVLSAWRWQRVLAVFERDVPIRALTTHYLAGLFVGNVLPSTIGGDVLRVSRAAATVRSAEVSFASVVLERLTGFVALPLLVFAGFLGHPEMLDQDAAWVALVVAGVTLGMLAVVLWVAGHPRLAGRFADHENWMRFVGAVHLGVDRIRRHPQHVFAILATALAYQTSVVVSVALVFRALDLPVPIAGAFAFVPAVAMMQVLPVSFNGLGVREGMLVLFLRPFGVSSAQAVAAGLLWFTTTLVVSMLGAPAFAVGNRQRHRRAIADPAPLENREPSE